ncbi:secreted RxLR effector protein 161-like [Aristolochia californica]|uniref:secreted RxLR effector protein 161-like n=1 Tax=Aristolochia californica TaxID=171875 RepID=UPI0035D58216
MHKPQVTHWQALERILRYLKGAPGRGLLYKKYGHFNIENFSYADWGSPNDRKSTSVYCTPVRGNLVTWKSKKQNVAARSSAKVEYRGPTIVYELVGLTMRTWDAKKIPHTSLHELCGTHKDKATSLPLTYVYVIEEEF